MKRSEKCLGKLDRLNKTLNHEEADQVPISDFFWAGFLKRWRKELNLPDDANPYDKGAILRPVIISSPV